MKNIKILIYLLLMPVFLFSQTEMGNIETYISGKITDAPGSSGDNYVVPTSSQLTTWSSVIDFILADNLVSARSISTAINYQITEFTDTSISPNQIFYVLEEKSPQTKYWGVYVFSKTPIRNNLIIQAPHSKYDTNTGKEAVYCFKNTVARALFINGTHRCNSDNFSSCSGKTSACGTKDSFRESDMAHTTISVFQKTTEIMFNSISNSVFIQLHGFGKKSTDPYVIISNGTRETPNIDYAILLKNALFSEDNTLTFKLAHINTSWTRLIGFTNTQGRLINNSSDFCSTSAMTTSGRFIHIEQEKTKLRNNVTGWRKMSNALSNTFPVTLSVDKFKSENKITITPNPTYGEISINGENIRYVEIFNILGQKINKTQSNRDKIPVLIDLKNQLSGVYIFKINTADGIFTKKVILVR